MQPNSSVPATTKSVAHPAASSSFKRSRSQSPKSVNNHKRHRKSKSPEVSCHVQTNSSVPATAETLQPLGVSSLFKRGSSHSPKSPNDSRKNRESLSSTVSADAEQNCLFHGNKNFDPLATSSS